MIATAFYGLVYLALCLGLILCPQMPLPLMMYSWALVSFYYVFMIDPLVTNEKKR
jgi:hypothetical protein